MGDLSEVRKKIAHLFQFTGVDFAGYFEVKQSIWRNAPYKKCYVPAFVYMVSKAIHLEVGEGTPQMRFSMLVAVLQHAETFRIGFTAIAAFNFIGAYSELPNLLYDAKQQHKNNRN